jgi:hypothetical protein
MALWFIPGGLIARLPTLRARLWQSGPSRPARVAAARTFSAREFYTHVHYSERGRVRSSRRRIGITELANGSIGYIPTKKAFDLGNYDVVSARCAAGNGEKLVDDALR